MKKAVFALFALLLGAGAAQAGDDWADHYYKTYPSGIRGYTDTVLLKEFDADEAAMRAVLADKPVLVAGVVESVWEATYYSDHANTDSAQSGVLAIGLDAYVNNGNFVVYLFDDVVPPEQLPVILQKGAMTNLLCEDVQRGPGGVGLQGKCKILKAFPFNERDFPEYVNEELNAWLRTPAEVK